MQKLLNRIFTKLGGKVAHGPQKTPSDFGSNLDHVTLALRLGSKLGGYTAIVHMAGHTLFGI